MRDIQNPLRVVKNRSGLSRVRTEQVVHRTGEAVACCDGDIPSPMALTRRWPTGSTLYLLNPAQRPRPAWSVNPLGYALLTQALHMGI